MSYKLNTVLVELTYFTTNCKSWYIPFALHILDELTTHFNLHRRKFWNENFLLPVSIENSYLHVVLFQ